MHVHHVQFPALTEYGWVRHEFIGILDVTWDTSDNITAVQRRVEHALKGCKCKTGCVTRRCTCMKKLSFITDLPKPAGTIFFSSQLFFGKYSHE